MPVTRAGWSALAGAIVSGAILAGLPIGALAQGGEALEAAQIGVSMQPESVTVGDPLLLRVRIRAPAGATIEFPTGPDSGAKIEAIASRAVSPATATPDMVDQTVTYRLVAWDVGDVPAALGDVVISLGGAQRSLSLADVTVRVTSVLPADTTLHVPKPPRPPLDIASPWWLRWWPLLLALLLLALLAWWWWRRRGRGAGSAAGMDPHEFAERQFARVEALGLVEAGERGRHVALMVEVLRDYLALRLPGARASFTSGELLAALRSSRAVPLERLARVLDEADLVKFARRSVTTDRARELGRDARAIARDVEKNVAAAASAAPVPQKAAA